MSLLFLLTLEMEGDDRLSSWFGYGLLWGVVALTNTSLIAWLPFSGVLARLSVASSWQALPDAGGVELR